MELRREGEAWGVRGREEREREVGREGGGVRDGGREGRREG